MATLCSMVILDRFLWCHLKCIVWVLILYLGEASMLGHGASIGSTGPAPRMGLMDNFSLVKGPYLFSSCQCVLGSADTNRYEITNRSQPDSSSSNSAFHMLDPKLGMSCLPSFRTERTTVRWDASSRHFCLNGRFLHSDGLAAGNLGVSDGQCAVCSVHCCSVEIC